LYKPDVGLSERNALHMIITLLKKDCSITAVQSSYSAITASKIPVNCSYCTFTAVSKLQSFFVRAICIQYHSMPFTVKP
jgi:hypothetical protein